MFQSLGPTPADPILGLNKTFQEDPRTEKVNLSVGVYQDATGQTPVFKAVKKAEEELLSAQTSKSYIPQIGDERFLEESLKLLFGEPLKHSLGDRITAVMTPGGCGALRMLGELLNTVKPGASVWVSDPTWANHYPLLESAGLTLKNYRYYSADLKGVDFSGMLDSLNAIPEGDIVLLHGCCHNPTGADLTREQSDQVVQILQSRNLLPFIDVAYQGFGDGLDADAYLVRKAAQELPEVVIANSFSKNLGLYRERTGVAIVVGQNAKDAHAAGTHIMMAARRSYSMSPYHGGGVAGLVLATPEYRSEWVAELDAIRIRMNKLRNQLVDSLNAAQDVINFDFVARSHGMFCFLGISEQAVLDLRSEYAIYLLNSTRINVAGLSEKNLPVVVERVAQVINR